MSDHDLKRRAVNLIAGGLTPAQVEVFLEQPEGTLDTWKATDPAFSGELTRVEMEADNAEKLENEVLDEANRAFGGSPKAPK